MTKQVGGGTLRLVNPGTFCYEGNRKVTLAAFEMRSRRLGTGPRLEPLPILDVYDAVKRFNEENGTNVKLMDPQTADLVLTSGSWREEKAKNPEEDMGWRHLTGLLGGFCFPTDSLVIVSPKLGSEVIFTEPSHKTQLVFQVPKKFQGAEGIALVARGMTADMFLRKKNKVDVNVPECAIVAVEGFCASKGRFPLDGWYHYDPVTTLTCGKELRLPAFKKSGEEIDYLRYPPERNVRRLMIGGEVYKNRDAWNPEWGLIVPLSRYARYKRYASRENTGWESVPVHRQSIRLGCRHFMPVLEVPEGTLAPEKGVYRPGQDKTPKTIGIGASKEELLQLLAHMDNAYERMRGVVRPEAVMEMLKFVAIIRSAGITERDTPQEKIADVETGIPLGKFRESIDGFRRELSALKRNFSDNVLAPAQKLRNLLDEAMVDE